MQAKHRWLFVWYQPNGNTRNNLLCEGQKYEKGYSAWFYREKVVAD